MSIERKILFVSESAGGGQILSSWIRTIRPYGKYLFCLQEPALSIFSDKLGSLELVELDYIRHLEAHRDQVITGTGLNPDFERQGMKIAKEAGVRTSSIIDHWKNYRERFLPKHLWNNVPKDWHGYLPDEVWVCDEHAFALALNLGFPADSMYQMKNPYLEEFQQALIEKSKNQIPKKRRDNIHILYLSEPMACGYIEGYMEGKYSDDADQNMVRSLIESVEQSRSKIKVRLRLHPIEARGKYKDITEGISYLENSLNSDLIDDLLWADAVIGIDSIALVLSLFSGKPVFSVIPEVINKEFVLPYQNILRCRSHKEVMKHLIKV